MLNRNTFRSNRGFSLIELLIVLVVVGILTAIAVPQMISQRRLLRTSSMVRETMAQMRSARQLAMSDRQAVTFRYNDTTKLITIINHHNNHRDPDLLDPTWNGCSLSRTALLTAPGYPMTACSRVASTYALNQGGLPASEITYGIPPGLPTVALTDTISMTPLLGGAGGNLNITFQNEGSVIDNVGLPLNRAMFIYNNRAAQTTASAISVIGASGRVKIWKYGGVIYVE